MSVDKPEKPELAERRARKARADRRERTELSEFQRFMAAAKLYAGIGLAFGVTAYLWLNWPQPHDHNWTLFGMAGALCYGLPLAWSGYRKLDR